MKKMTTWMMMVGVVLCLSSAAMADKTADETILEKAVVAEKAGMTGGMGIAIGGTVLGAALAALGGGMAIARVGSHCIESMARQPEAAGSMFAPMIVTAAMIEGAMLAVVALSFYAITLIFA
jgi:F-type H+-transporting ATPase subunit c